MHRDTLFQVGIGSTFGIAFLFFLLYYRSVMRKQPNLMFGYVGIFFALLSVVFTYGWFFDSGYF